MSGYIPHQIKLQDMISPGLNLNNPLYLIGITKHITDADEPTWKTIHCTHKGYDRYQDKYFQYTGLIWDRSLGMNKHLLQPTFDADNNNPLNKTTFFEAFYDMYDGIVSTRDIQNIKIKSHKNGILIVTTTFLHKSLVCKVIDRGLVRCFGYEYEFRLVDETKLKATLVEARLRSSL